MIEISCECGKKLSVPDSAGGRSGKCPACGKVLQIPKPAEKAASAPLELELEDAPPVSRAPATAAPPPESLYPPAQDLLGDEPPKKKGLTKPPVAAAMAKRDSGKHAAARPDQIPCPLCGAMYDKEMVFCTKCSVDLESGRPISGLTPGRALLTKSGYPEGYDPEIPFWKICVQMLYKPWVVMEYFQGYFESKNMQIQMLAFWIASFLVVGIAASNKAGKAMQGEVKTVPDEVRAAEIEKKADPVQLWVPTSWTNSGTEGAQSNNGKPFMIRVNEPQEAVEAGRPFTVRMNICEPGPGKGIDGDLWAFPTDGFRGRPDGERVMGRSGQLGEYDITLQAELLQGAWYQFELFPRGADPESRSVVPMATLWMCWPTKPGWGMKVVQADKAPETFNVEEEIAKRESRPGRFRAATELKQVIGQPEGMVAQHSPFFYRFVDPPQQVEPGKNMTIKIGLWQSVDNVQGDPMTELEVYMTTTSAWGFDDDDGGEASKPKIVKAGPVESGIWAAELESLWQRETIVQVVLCYVGKTPEESNGRFAVLTAEIPSGSGWSRPGVEKEKAEFDAEKKERTPDAVASKIEKILTGPMAIVGEILANILNIAISAALFTLAARLLGGGGSFLLMALTLAFLQGFANFLSLILLFVPDHGTQLMVALGLGVYALLLRLIALMKVYDTSFGVALLTAVVAFLIQQFIVIALLIGAFGAAVALAG